MTTPIEKLKALESAATNPFACHVCQRSPATGVTTFRINPKGVPGIFACKLHCDPDPITEDICAQLVVDLQTGRRKP